MSSTTILEILIAINLPFDSPGLNQFTMVVRIYIFTRRRADLTSEQYKHHYENVHMPLLKSISGDAWPTSHTRHYIPRNGDGSQVQLIMGEPGPDFDFDCFSEAVYEDQEHMQRHVTAMGNPENVKLREDDEERFLDRKSVKIFMVEDAGGD